MKVIMGNMNIFDFNPYYLVSNNCVPTTRIDFAGMH